MSSLERVSKYCPEVLGERHKNRTIESRWDNDGTMTQADLTDSENHEHKEI